MEKADVILIHVRSVQSREKLLHDLKPRDPSQPWVMFDPETHIMSNPHLRYKYHTLNGIFNRTFHHRRDSDILMVHGFIVGRGSDANLLPPSWRTQPILWPTTNRTKLAVTFISNCKDQSGRLKYIREFQQFASIDVYGKCGPLRCGSSRYAQHEYQPHTDPCMITAGENYLFFFAFENALCEDYATEKIYNLLYYPMVPVVLGAADYSQLLPPNSFINARSFTPKQLAHRLTYLATHPQDYFKLLEWRQYYQPSTVGGARVFCDLCTQLHDPHFYQSNVYHNFYDWYVVKANCNRNGTMRFSN
ncbi:hypothetical protein Pmani_013110 [Petrolisthes manimaculis]|uniref:Fucosyltransferase n=1 Tax=Petrolisthes manimaculis TaxID=1843537 RepID=A0AAE1U9N6_9EUCA|nr:hypothetical protein Pmani_013110 [Petrolisthes manimaculis]